MTTETETTTMADISTPRPGLLRGRRAIVRTNFTFRGQTPEDVEATIAAYPSSEASEWAMIRFDDDTLLPVHKSRIVRVLPAFALDSPDDAGFNGAYDTP